MAQPPSEDHGDELEELAEAARRFTLAFLSGKARIEIMPPQRGDSLVEGLKVRLVFDEPQSEA